MANTFCNNQSKQNHITSAKGRGGRKWKVTRRYDAEPTLVNERETGCIKAYKDENSI